MTAVIICMFLRDKQVKNSRLNNEIYRMYGDDPEVRSWLHRLSQKAKRNRQTRKALADDSMFGGDNLHISRR